MCAERIILLTWKNCAPNHQGSSEKQSRPRRDIISAPTSGHRARPRADGASLSDRPAEAHLRLERSDTRMTLRPVWRPGLRAQAASVTILMRGVMGEDGGSGHIVSFGKVCIWISIWAPFAYAEPSSGRNIPISPLIELSITSRAHSPSFPAPAVALNRPLALVSRCALAIKPRHTSADLEPDTCHGSLTRVTHHSSSRASEREALHRHRLRPPRSSCPAQAHRGHAARPPRQRPSLAARAEQ